MAAETPSPRRASDPHAWLSRRTLCLLLLLLAAALAADFWVPVVHSSFDDTASGVGVPNHDYFQYYAAGHNWDLGLDPYRNHPGDARALQSPRVSDRRISGYIYPPTLLPLYGALARASYEDARTAWLALDVAVFALAVGVAVAVTRGRRLEVLTAAVLLTMVSFPFFYHVHEGQVDMIVAGLSLSAFLLYPRWRGWPSAMLLAVAVATKLTPVLLLAVMVAYYRDWRFLLKTAVCGLAVLAVSLAAVDVSLYGEYVADIMPKISRADPSPYNQTLLRFSADAPLVTRVVSLLGYAALVALAWLAGRNSRRLTDGELPVERTIERDAVLLLSVLFMLLFSPLAWQMAYVWVIVPLALLFAGPPPRDRPWVVLLLGVAAALLSMRVWPVRGLDTVNVIGAAVAVLCLMRCYLPLETRREGAAPPALE